MAKKILKSASGDYRATQKPSKGPAGDRGVMTTTGIRRTVKGVLSGAPTVKERTEELGYREASGSGSGLKYIMKQKKGGAIKKKK
jgi:hypothetical protein